MIAKECIGLIKEFEALRLNAYLDEGDVPTIGWGTTSYRAGGKVKMGDIITISQAEDELIKDCEEIQEQLMTYITNIKHINSHHISALTSLVYNIGIGAFKLSTMLKLINKGDIEKAANEFDRWVYVKGEKSNGLIRRRAAEKQLFLTAS